VFSATIEFSEVGVTGHHGCHFSFLFEASSRDLLVRIFFRELHIVDFFIRLPMLRTFLGTELIQCLIILIFGIHSTFSPGVATMIWATIIILGYSQRKVGSFRLRSSFLLFFAIVDFVITLLSLI